MYRGTTPTFTFTLPIECETITKLSVAFKQGGKLRVHRVDLGAGLFQCVHLSTSFG